MRFSSVAVVASIASLTVALDHTVLVGDAGLDFNPPIVNASTGDLVIFQFMSKNHSVVASSFPSPCTKSGIDSGFHLFVAGAPPPTFNLSVTNSSGALWFFCSQVGHCGQGMVFAINTNQEKFNAFVNAAKATSGQGNSGNSSSTGGGYGGYGGGSSVSSPAPGASGEASPKGSGNSNGAVHMVISSTLLFAFSCLLAGLIL